MKEAGDDGRRKLLIGVGAAVLLVLVVVVALALSGGGADPQTVTPVADGNEEDEGQATQTLAPETSVPGTTVAPETTTSTTTTTTTTTEPPFVCPQGFCAHIEEVTVDSGELVIEWTTHGGWEPNLSNFHAHFYYDIYEAVQVGTNWQQNGAASGGSWQLTDQQPFRTAGSSVSVGAAPAGTTAICVVPAASDHGTISPENAECWDLPPELLP